MDCVKRQAGCGLAEAPPRRSGCWALITAAILKSMVWVPGLVSAPAMALDVHGEISGRSEYTDNSRRTSANKEDDVIHTPQLDLSVVQKDRLLDIQADYRLEHRKYVNKTFSDNTLLTGASRVDAQIAGDTLHWLIRHNRSETAVNTRLQNTPDNQQVTNSLSTGPRLRWAISPRNLVEASLEYESINENRSGNDSQRVMLDTHITRKLDEASSFGVRLNASDVKFQAQGGNDYRRGDFRFTYARELGERSKFDVELGGVDVNRERGRTERDWSGAFNGSFRFTPGWSADVSMSREATDQATQALGGARQFGATNNERSDISDAFVLSTARAALIRAGERLNVTWSVQVARQNYDQATRDEQRRGTALRLAYRIGPKVTLDAAGSLEVLDFEGQTGHDIQRDGDVRVSWRPGKNFKADVGVSVSSRDSPRDAVTYRERRASVGLGYDF